MDKNTIDICKEIVSHQNIVLKENKSEYKMVNKNRIEVNKYQVDGCIYKEGTIATRCDYLIDAQKKLFFIELKGSDVKKGLQQILDTINNLTPFFEYISLNARIITIRGIKPNRLNTYKEYRNILKLIGKQGVIIANTPFQESIK